MKKILLVAPPFYRLMGSHYNGMHLGIAYIDTFLKQHGHEVRVYNADYYDTDKYLDQVQLFNNYSLYKTILNDLSHPIWNEIRDKISSFTADFIGIAMMTANYKSARNVEDLAMGSVAALKPAAKNKTYTLVSREPVSIKKLAEMIRGMFNNRVAIDFDAARKDDRREESAQLDTARNELGWEPKVDLEEGIRRYIEWYKENVGQRKAH